MGKKLFDYNLKRKIPKVTNILDSETYMYKEEEPVQEEEPGKVQVDYVRLPQTECGIFALTSAIAALTFSVVSLVMIYNSQGKPPKVASILVFCSMIWAVAALVFGIAGLKEKEKSYLTAWMSISGGALVLAVWIIVLIIGNGRAV